MSSIPFEPHMRFGRCVSRRYQVFNTVRHEKLFSLMKAYDLVENRSVYLACLPREVFRDFPQARWQLQLQADQVRRLSGPLLLNILFSGETEDLFFFVEEQPRGETLAEVIRERRKRDRPFSDREALGLCWLLCEALERVQQVTVHGFLHPLDIYLDPWPEGPIPFYPRIAHIGIRGMLRAVRAPFEGLEEETACYASPEFGAYEPLQKQVDVYGTGAVLYAMLTLRAPTGRFVRPSSVRPGLPETLDRILLRALDEDPKERYMTPSVFARALEGLSVLGTFRQEMESAAGRLPAGGMLKGAAELQGRGTGMWEGPSSVRDEPAGGGVARGGAFSLLFSDKVRAVCLLLLALLNLGLFCQAAREAGSCRQRDLPDAKERSRWESMFSDSGPGGSPGPIGVG